MNALVIFCRLRLNPLPLMQVELKSPLPFTLQGLKSSIPAECFQSSAPLSIAYFIKDCALIGGLYWLAHYLDSWFFYPLFWVLQGTLFWALFVVGHDCGHQSFSRYTWLNNLIGHLAHTPILVPFHGWRISHRTHHQNTGNIETDESWYPISESDYNALPPYLKVIRYSFTLFLYPLYLFKRSPSRPEGSHFNPNSPLFKPAERTGVLVSTIACILMVLLLVGLTVKWGIAWFLTYYFVPYVIFVMWLDLVTFLHHTDPEIPWYRGEDWNFLKGALSTIDRDYGWVNDIHHNIGTHVVHHLFSSIPHYHLLKATEAIKPVLGSYYRKGEVPILSAFKQSEATCYFVPDTGSPVYYQAPNQNRSDSEGLGMGI